MSGTSSPMLLAGSLRTRLTMQRPTTTRSASGSTVQVFEDWFDFWGAVEPLNSRALFAAMQVQSLATTTIRLRYRPGITAQMRVRYLRRAGVPPLYDYYTIEGPPIDPDMRHHELHLLCVLRETEGFRVGPTVLTTPGDYVALTDPASGAPLTDMAGTPLTP